MYILIFLLVLGLVVLIHELGHFIFARRAGILCHEFSIGMGPALYKFKRGETTYAIRAIPIGGYVSAAGEEPETSKIKAGQIIYLGMKGSLVDEIYFYKPEQKDVKEAKVIDFDLYGKDGDKLYIHYEDHAGSTHFASVKRDAFYVMDENTRIQIAPYDRCYESKPWINRFLFVVMGAGFNFILATVIFIIINFSVGIQSNEPVLSNPGADSPASNAGLLAGDKIISINNDPVGTWEDITDYLDKYEGQPVTLEIKRDGEIIEKTIQPMFYVGTLGFGSHPDYDPTTTAYIGTVTGNSNAQEEGLKSGDQIIKIEGRLNDDKNTEKVENAFISEEVENWNEVNAVLKQFYLGETIKLTIIPKGHTESKVVEINAIKALEPDNVSDTYIGISPVYEFRLFKSIGKGVTDTLGVIGDVFKTLDLLFNDKNVGISDLSGPVGIYDMTKTFAMSGFLALLSWVAFISANIGFVNLLPLPALDGGRLIFLIIEGIIRRPVNRKVEGYIHTIGFLLFMMLFIFITFNDFSRLFS